MFYSRNSRRLSRSYKIFRASISPLTRRRNKSPKKSLPINEEDKIIIYNEDGDMVIKCKKCESISGTYHMYHQHFIGCIYYTNLSN